MTQTFTPRERQVIEALLNGKRPKQIAFDLGISQQRVSKCIMGACERRGATNKEQLIDLILRDKYGVPRDTVVKFN